jgi:hypothetical protein
MTGLSLMRLPKRIGLENQSVFSVKPHFPKIIHFYLENVTLLAST